MSLQQRITAAIPPRGIKVAHLRAQFRDASPGALDAALQGVLAHRHVRVGDSIVTRRELPDVTAPDPLMDAEIPKRRPRKPSKAHPWALANTASVAQATVRRAAIEALRERDAVRRRVYEAWRAVRRAA